MTEELTPEQRQAKAFGILIKVATKKGNLFEQISSPVMSFMEQATLKIADPSNSDRRIGAYLIANTLLDLTAAMNAYFLGECLLANGLLENDDQAAEARVGIAELIPTGLDLVIEGLQKLGIPTTAK